MESWYELQIMILDNKVNFYKDLENLSDENAGYDLHSSCDVIIKETPEFIPFGIVVRMIKATKTLYDINYENSHFWLSPRSSIYKTGLIMANSMGVIDKSYTGELKAPVWSITGDSRVKFGDRLFQIVAPDMGWIRSVKIVDSMSTTERGSGGFGSSGK